MKKFLLLFFSVWFMYACKKEKAPVPEQQVVTGELHYSDPASDGPGLYYMTDSAETLIIKDDTANLESVDPKYADFVNIHSRLTFTYSGEKGCLWSMIPGPCMNPLRKVVVIRFSKL